MSNINVVGVNTKRKEHISDFKARITIDVAGIVAAVRTSLSSDSQISENINSSDIGIGYREYRQLDKNFDDFSAINYDWTISNGGYCWIISKKTI